MMEIIKNISQSFITIPCEMMWVLSVQKLNV